VVCRVVCCAVVVTWRNLSHASHIHQKHAAHDVSATQAWKRRLPTNKTRKRRQEGVLSPSVPAFRSNKLPADRPNACGHPGGGGDHARFAVRCDPVRGRVGEGSADERWREGLRLAQSRGWGKRGRDLWTYLLMGESLEDKKRHCESPEEHVEGAPRCPPEAQVEILLVLGPLLDRLVPATREDGGHTRQTMGQVRRKKVRACATIRFCRARARRARDEANVRHAVLADGRRPSDRPAATHCSVLCALGWVWRCCCCCCASLYVGRQSTGRK
jgi:hypothetical protein